VLLAGFIPEPPIGSRYQNCTHPVISAWLVSLCAKWPRLLQILVISGRYAPASRHRALAEHAVSSL
jgi:hypothetical protein